MAAASVTTLNEVYAAATQWREEWRYVMIASGKTLNKVL